MTASPARGYRFRTPKQWGACLFDAVDPVATAVGKVQPLAPFEQQAKRHETKRAYAPVVTRTGEIIWRDRVGCLHRLEPCDDAPRVSSAPYPIAHAERLISTTGGLWVIDESRTSLLRFDEESLTRLAVLDIDAKAIDLASDGYDRLFVLVEDSQSARALRIDCSGRSVATIVFDGICEATALIFLRSAKRFVVLTGGADPHVHWFAEQGGPALTSLRVAALHPCFHALALGGDSRTRALIVGTDGAAFGGKSFVLVFDGDGVSLGEVPLEPQDSPPTGITATRDALIVTGPSGLLQFAIATAVPDGTAQVRCSLITPVLYSPDREDQRRWLRIEATADLPPSATLEISYAATEDKTLRDQLAAIASDRTLLASGRVRKLLQQPGIWSAPLAFHGSATPDASPVEVSAPLFDVHEPYVWVCITLIATAGGTLPALSELVVRYPGQTLMQNLPAIYRRDEAQPGSFIRRLVGVLETTTQGLDARIAALGSYIHPATAPRQWLDFIARWLGLPWDDALSDAQKQCLIAHASELARQRGTRAGLELLLACLMPQSPRRFRIVDANVDFGFATVGGEACRGSALPALLGGRTPWNTELDASSVIGRMRLPCAGQVDDGVRHLTGRIRVDVAASGDERRAWEPWLAALINEMVPITARVQLRWTSPQSLRGTPRVGSMVLEAPTTPRLGSDAITGIARLPERGTHITSTGADVGTRLQ
jgi:phage tail-like protein